MKAKETSITRVARFYLLFISLTFSSISYAQPPDGGGPPPDFKKLTSAEIAETQTAWMKKKLGLTKDQLEEVNKINNSFAAKMQEYLGTAQQNTIDKKSAAKLAELDKEKDIVLKGILTEKQFTTYIKKKMALGNGFENGAMPPPPPPPGGF